MIIENLTIEELKKVDLEEVYNVFKVTIPKAFKESEDDVEEKILEQEIHHKRLLLNDSIYNKPRKNVFLIAKDKNKVIGTIAYGECSNAIRECTNNEFSDIGELNSLFILPEYQGKGVGSKLINALMEYLNENGIEEFCFDSGYKQAQVKWIKKFGEPYKIVKDFWAPGVDNMIWKCKVKL